MAFSVLDFDRNPALSDVERLQSFLESVQRAFNEFELTHDDLELEKHPLMLTVTKDNKDFRVMFKDYGEFKVITTEAIEAVKGDFKNLYAEMIKADEIIVKALKTEYAEADEAVIKQLSGDLADYKKLIAKTLESDYAKIETLDADYARLDQTNITQAWVMDLMVTGNFLADDFNAATGSFSKWLTGVNIVGDMIKGGTIETERLIIRDPETNRGILYEINNGVVDQTKLSEEELKRLCLDGKILVAESVTADKINVADLFSQNITATGNFNLGEGGALVYDADTDTLTIRAKEILMSSGMSVEEGLAEVKHASLIEAYDEYATSSSVNVEPADDEWSTDKPTAGDGIYIWQRRANVYGNGDIVYGPAVCITGSKGDSGEDAAVVYIESSEGNSFKNNDIETTITVHIYKGDLVIKDINALRKAYGPNAHLQWYWHQPTEGISGPLDTADSRFSDDGFTLNIRADDYKNKVVFYCDVNS